MRNQGCNGHGEEKHHCKGGSCKRKGAKTFRRGRAIAFLETLNMKRDTLKQQLATPELQSINPILVGELKAIDMVIEEFKQLFELYEFEGKREGCDKHEHEDRAVTSI